MKLKDRVAIITGGGTGIGKGIARCFAREGARLMLAQRRLEVAERTAGELGGRAMTCDVSSRSQVERLIEETLGHYGRIDILVNNAAITGLPALTPFLECSEEAWDTILDVNLKGTFLCSQLAARHMVSRGQGVIINISSVGAYAAQSWAAAYCASKGGMEGLTKAMALDLSSHGIRVVGSRRATSWSRRTRNSGRNWLRWGWTAPILEKPRWPAAGCRRKSGAPPSSWPRTTPASFTEPR